MLTRSSLHACNPDEDDFHLGRRRVVMLVIALWLMALALALFAPAAADRLYAIVRAVLHHGSA